MHIINVYTTSSIVKINIFEVLFKKYYYSMLDLNETKTETEDQIDLRLVIRIVISYFKRYRKLIYGLSALGLVLGIVLWYTTKPTYKTSLIAKTDYTYLLNSEVITIIESLQKLRAKNEFEQLSERLNISEEKVKMLKKINALPVSIETAPNYTQTSFNISVEVSSNQILDSLQLGIINLLENTNYVKVRQESKLIRLQSLRVRLQKELNDLDSVKSLVNEVIKNGRSPTVFSDPGNINTRIIDLYEKMLITEESIKFVKPVQVIEGFKKFKLPDSPRLSIHVLGGLIIGFITSILIILIIFIRKEVHFFQE
ncbi:hypothetical protein Q0590_02655 [Rhodocytophaga aerolata]|uniref:Polysaccharide chain length determinant N-terminal domain-containing protein n=1 Tax=Rhodocytophaga aerolata TaxID=455078 RepID=A0ABT8QZ58_9BACT|nr:hypothetical protein [Rhodocytophaga aerolata]MDO1445130.1 hypothetical protein [Rhodocytophaga aerolata]